MKPKSPQPEPAERAPLVTIQELDHAPEPVAEPVPAVGVLSALLEFVLPSEAQRHGATMGRNARHDLLCVAEHLIEASNRLKSVAVDATAAREWDAVNFLKTLIERLA